MSACKCESYYTGNYCEQERNDCLLGDVCNLYGKKYSNSSCQKLTIAEQKAQGLTYKCVNFTCASGFSANANGACEDVNECSQTPNPCPADAVSCINSIGSFTCDCGRGKRYRNNICETIDYCSTPLDNCQHICNPVFAGFTCACYPGYTLSADNKTCTRSMFIFLKDKNKLLNYKKC